MLANNITVSLPNLGCNKDCPYCISKLTPQSVNNIELFGKNIFLLENLVKRSNAASLLITGKGEPLLNPYGLRLICQAFSNQIILELQTNGLLIEKGQSESSIIKECLEKAINVIAFSIDNIKDWEYLIPTMSKYAQMGKVIRITLIVSKLLPENFNFTYAIKLARESQANQITFRKTDYPKHSIGNNVVTEWIKDNANEVLYNKLKDEFLATNSPIVRKLCWGPSIYDYNGIGLTFFDKCIQETNTNENIRSLIYQSDGHLYTSWNKGGSILF